MLSFFCQVPIFAALLTLARDINFMQQIAIVAPLLVALWEAKEHAMGTQFGALGIQFGALGTQFGALHCSGEQPQHNTPAIHLSVAF